MTHNSIATEHLFSILQHPSRRHTLAVLERADTTMTVRDVTNEIVTRESASPLPDVPADTVKRTYLSLIHVHIPMLADANLIEYDPDRGVIDAAALDDIEPLLSLTTDERSPLEPAR